MARAHLPASIALAIALGAGACASPPDAVTPAGHDTFLRREVAHNLEVQVTLTDLPPSTEPIDILLLFDATSSMANVIDAVRSAASGIIAEVGRLSSNAAFGVASFADYTPGDDPWRLHLDLSADTGRVTAALDNVSLQNGINEERIAGVAGWGKTVGCALSTISVNCFKRSNRKTKSITKGDTKGDTKGHRNT